MNAAKTARDLISSPPAPTASATMRSRADEDPFHIDLQLATRTRGMPTKADFQRWAGAVPALRVSVTVRLAGVIESRRLNRSYRGKDYATNVLSFRYERSPGVAVGDLLLCAPVIASEARQQGKPTAAHYAHLTIHGMLHLLGYNHERAPQAAKMERIETCILHSLGFTDPYGDHP